MKKGMNRREFIKMTAGATAALGISSMVPWRYGARDAMAFSNSIPLAKFIQPLRMFGPDIPVASPDTSTYSGVDFYNITAGWYRDQLHPSLPTAGTRLYGYGSSLAANGQLDNGKHLGHAIVATKGRPVRIKFSNALPASHIIPFDSTIPSPGNGGSRQDRAAIHLHGGLIPWASDGGPFHWIANPNNAGGAAVGSSVVNWLPDKASALTNDYFYPNNQSSRLMWYHDHAIGTTRISAYAGLATGYLIYDPSDPVEQALGSIGYSPADFLIFQDKIFWNPLLDPGFATYVTGAQAGDLWYPYLYERNRWKINGNKFTPPIPSAIPEYFGDTMLVNGSVYPYRNVNAGTYRFRILNACNARFLSLKFVMDDGTGEPLGGYLAPTIAPVNAWIIGNEGGFLNAPVQIFSNGMPMAGFVATPLLPGPFVMAPAERVDILVDFSQCGGKNVLLYNDAQAPFPVGAPVNDYYPGSPKNPVITQTGTGPNTRTLMQFRVSNASGFDLATTLQAINPIFNSSINNPNPVLPTVASANGGLTLSATPGTVITHNGSTYNYLTTTQEITLNEVYDVYGRLQQLVGTNVPLVKGTFGRTYLDAPTETATYGTVQIWNIYNLTADTHPMHFHLFNVQILKRQPIKVNAFNGIPSFTGPGRGPDAGEVGWKETVRMNPGECTTIAVLVDDPNPDGGRTYLSSRTKAPSDATLPSSPRLLSSYGVTGDEYVFHCHILEHEEHDMMRPLVGS